MSSSAYLHTPGAIASVIEKFVREQEADPWALIQNEVGCLAGASGAQNSYSINAL